MDTDTLLAISAGATFLLALAAFWAIRQTSRIRNKDFRARSLNEINNWAKEGLVCLIKTRRDTGPEIINQNRIIIAPVQAENGGIVSLASIFGNKFKSVDWDELNKRMPGFFY